MQDMVVGKRRFIAQFIENDEVVTRHEFHAVSHTGATRGASTWVKRFLGPRASFETDWKWRSRGDCYWRAIAGGTLELHEFDPPQDPALEAFIARAWENPWDVETWYSPELVSRYFTYRWEQDRYKRDEEILADADLLYDYPGAPKAIAKGLNMSLEELREELGELRWFHCERCDEPFEEFAPRVQDGYKEFTLCERCRQLQRTRQGRRRAAGL